MMKNNYEEMDKNSTVVESGKVKTWNWQTYGNFITEVIIALAELISNAIDAALFLPGHKRVDINIENHDGIRWLVIKNSGVPINNLLEALNFGYTHPNDRAKTKNKKGKNNQYHTGLKSALSYFWPFDNGLFYIFTRREDGWDYISGPYDEDKKVFKTKMKKEESWVSTIVEVAVRDDIDFTGIESKIGQYFAMVYLMDMISQTSDNPIDIEINFNGKRVTPIVPKNVAINNVRSGEYNISGVQGISKNVIVNGKNVVITKFEFTLPEKTNEYYYPSKMRQGWYLFYNMRLIKHMGLYGILKSNHSDKNIVDFEDDDNSKYLKPHDSMNRLITFINIDVDSPEAGLSLNNHKTNCDFRKKNDKQLLKIINEFAGDRFRSKKDEDTEQRWREFFDVILKVFMKDSPFLYLRECYTSEDKDLIADAAIVRLNGPAGALPDEFKTECKTRMVLSEKELTKFINNNKYLRENGYSFGGVTHIIEYKKFGMTTKKNAGELRTYADDFKRHSNQKMPALLLVGGNITDCTDDFIKSYREQGYPMTFVSYQGKEVE